MLALGIVAEQPMQLEKLGILSSIRASPVAGNALKFELFWFIRNWCFANSLEHDHFDEMPLQSSRKGPWIPIEPAVWIGWVDSIERKFPHHTSSYQASSDNLSSKYAFKQSTRASAIDAKGPRKSLKREHNETAKIQQCNQKWLRPPCSHEILEFWANGHLWQSLLAVLWPVGMSSRGTLMRRNYTNARLEVQMASTHPTKIHCTSMMLQCYNLQK